MRRLGLSFLAFLIALAPAWGQTAAEKKATITYLQGLQIEKGGFQAANAKGQPERPSLRATVGGMRALKYFGGSARDPAAAARFARSCFDREKGGFGDAPKAPPNSISTAIGLMALVELKIPPEKIAGPAVRYLAEHARTFEEIRLAAAGLEAIHQRPAQADAWLRQLTLMRQDTGSARDVSSVVVTIMRLGGKVKDRDLILKLLRAGQRGDGGFGKEGEKISDLETCYRVVRAFHMFKEKPADEAALRRFVAKCRNADGGYGVAPGKASGAGPTYFAGIVLHWLEEK